MDDKTKDDKPKMDHKVISIFQKHRHGEQLHFDVEEGGVLVISPDGFNYVSFKTSNLVEIESMDLDTILEMAKKKHYIIKMLEHHKDSDRLNNYYVSADRLEEFLLSLSSRPGKVVEIERFYPDGPA